MIVFHVEDDMDIREIAKMSLEMTGDFTVVQYECGEAAIVGSGNVTPDVLLLDVMMPGMSGPETLSKLREMDHLATVPAIYMTARAQPNEIDEFTRTGALGVIIKPFDPVTLGQQILDIVAAGADA
ncbi:response regulator [Lentibacter sp. XHP0401]|jgi:two-component system, OmpR family, phosphate regulon response regulator PhoB|uniref:response regulator n=1 Tax=Lentibacter sp. XHP0401 TaxID=2984334 RepID=UPI0021E732D3|nr:response regulator [Lentibacter sp. XHP0401]MCV2894239.1 response regulator [Lentibacter sp. XHP0401]